MCSLRLATNMGSVEIHVLPLTSVAMVSIDGVPQGVAPVFVDLDASLPHDVVVQIGDVVSAPVSAAQAWRDSKTDN